MLCDLSSQMCIINFRSGFLLQGKSAKKASKEVTHEMDEKVDQFMSAHPGQLVPNLGTLTQGTITNTPVPCFSIKESTNFTLILQRWLTTIANLAASDAEQLVASITVPHTQLSLNVVTSSSTYPLMRHGSVSDPGVGLAGRLNAILSALLPVRNTGLDWICGTARC